MMEENMTEERIRPLGESMDVIKRYSSEFSQRGDSYGSRMGITLSNHLQLLDKLSEEEKVRYASKIAGKLEKGTLTE
ncbi:MAG: hypothetical protein JSW41_00350 [Candidatus Aenigmatarchaeota archaeon]|nr:MAG: hypothetical protein JSW41_00350 [Candidatus Aenigmarchaeota archaeon]